MKRKKTLIEFTSTRETRSDFNRLRSLLMCVSDDPTRKALHQVLVESIEDEEGMMILTATDGRRLRSDRFELDASPGTYEIIANTAKGAYLAKSRKKVNYPNHRQVIPSTSPESTHCLKGTGKNFVVWAASALGCMLDVKLLAIREDEEVTLSIQKEQPNLSPVVLKNEKTTFVLMPVRPEAPWVHELESLRQAA